MKKIFIKELIKIVLLCVLEYLLFFIFIVVFGYGKGIEKIDGWTNLNTKIMFMVFNLVGYMLLVILSILLYRFINRDKVSLISNIIQIIYIISTIYYAMFASETIFKTISMCTSFVEYLMTISMLVMFICSLVLCLNIYKVIKRKSNTFNTN